MTTPLSTDSASRTNTSADTAAPTPAAASSSSWGLGLPSFNWVRNLWKGQPSLALKTALDSLLKFQTSVNAYIGTWRPEDLLRLKTQCADTLRDLRALMEEIRRSPKEYNLADTDLRDLEACRDALTNSRLDALKNGAAQTNQSFLQDLDKGLKVFGKVQGGTSLVGRTTADLKRSVFNTSAARPQMEQCARLIHGLIVNRVQGRNAQDQEATLHLLQVLQKEIVALIDALTQQDNVNLEQIEPLTRLRRTLIPFTEQTASSSQSAELDIALSEAQALLKLHSHTGFFQRKQNTPPELARPLELIQAISETHESRRQEAFKRLGLVDIRAAFASLREALHHLTLLRRAIPSSEGWSFLENLSTARIRDLEAIMLHISRFSAEEHDQARDYALAIRELLLPAEAPAPRYNDSDRPAATAAAVLARFAKTKERPDQELCEEAVKTRATLASFVVHARQQGLLTPLGRFYLERLALDLGEKANNAPALRAVDLSDGERLLSRWKGATLSLDAEPLKALAQLSERAKELAKTSLTTPNAESLAELARTLTNELARSDLETSDRDTLLSLVTPLSAPVPSTRQEKEKLRALLTTLSSDLMTVVRAKAGQRTRRSTEPLVIPGNIDYQELRYLLGSLATLVQAITGRSEEAIKNATRRAFAVLAAIDDLGGSSPKAVWSKYNKAIPFSVIEKLDSLRQYLKETYERRGEGSCNPRSDQYHFFGQNSLAMRELAEVFTILSQWKTANDESRKAAIGRANSLVGEREQHFIVDKSILEKIHFHELRMSSEEERQTALTKKADELRAQLITPKDDEERALVKARGNAIAVLSSSPSLQEAAKVLAEHECLEQQDQEGRLYRAQTASVPASGGYAGTALSVGMNVLNSTLLGLPEGPALQGMRDLVVGASLGQLKSVVHNRLVGTGISPLVPPAPRQDPLLTASAAKQEKEPLCPFEFRHLEHALSIIEKAAARGDQVSRLEALRQAYALLITIFLSAAGAKSLQESEDTYCKKIADHYRIELGVAKSLYRLFYQLDAAVQSKNTNSYVLSLSSRRTSEMQAIEDMRRLIASWKAADYNSLPKLPQTLIAHLGEQPLPPLPQNFEQARMRYYLLSLKGEEAREYYQKKREEIRALPRPSSPAQAQAYEYALEWAERPIPENIDRDKTYRKTAAIVFTSLQLSGSSTPPVSRGSFGRLIDQAAGQLTSFLPGAAGQDASHALNRAEELARQKAFSELEQQRLFRVAQQPMPLSLHAPASLRQPEQNQPQVATRPANQPSEIGSFLSIGYDLFTGQNTVPRENREAAGRLVGRTVGSVADQIGIPQNSALRLEIEDQTVGRVTQNRRQAPVAAEQNAPREPSGFGSLLGLAYDHMTDQNTMPPESREAAGRLVGRAVGRVADQMGIPQGSGLRRELESQTVGRITGERAREQLAASQALPASQVAAPPTRLQQAGNLASHLYGRLTDDPNTPPILPATREMLDEGFERVNARVGLQGGLRQFVHRNTVGALAPQATRPENEEKRSTTTSRQPPLTAPGHRRPGGDPPSDPPGPPSGNSSSQDMPREPRRVPSPAPNRPAADQPSAAQPSSQPSGQANGWFSSFVSLANWGYALWAGQPEDDREARAIVTSGFNSLNDNFLGLPPGRTREQLFDNTVARVFPGATAPASAANQPTPEFILIAHDLNALRQAAPAAKLEAMRNVYASLKTLFPTQTQEEIAQKARVLGLSQEAVSRLVQFMFDIAAAIANRATLSQATIEDVCKVIPSEKFKLVPWLGKTLFGERRATLGLSRPIIEARRKYYLLCLKATDEERAFYENKAIEAIAALRNPKLTAPQKAALEDARSHFSRVPQRISSAYRNAAARILGALELAAPTHADGLVSQKAAEAGDSLVSSMGFRGVLARDLQDGVRSLGRSASNYAREFAEQREILPPSGIRSSSSASHAAPSPALPLAGASSSEENSWTSIASWGYGLIRGNTEGTQAPTEGVAGSVASILAEADKFHKYVKKKGISKIPKYVIKKGARALFNKLDNYLESLNPRKKKDAEKIAALKPVRDALYKAMNDGSLDDLGNCISEALTYLGVLGVQGPDVTDPFLTDTYDMIEQILDPKLMKSEDQQLPMETLIEREMESFVKHTSLFLPLKHIIESTCSFKDKEMDFYNDMILEAEAAGPEHERETLKATLLATLKAEKVNAAKRAWIEYIVFPFSTWIVRKGLEKTAGEFMEWSKKFIAKNNKDTDSKFGDRMIQRTGSYLNILRSAFDTFAAENRKPNPKTAVVLDPNANYDETPLDREIDEELNSPDANGGYSRQKLYNEVASKFVNQFIIPDWTGFFTWILGGGKTIESLLSATLQSIETDGYTHALNCVIYDWLQELASNLKKQFGETPDLMASEEDASKEPVRTMSMTQKENLRTLVKQALSILPLSQCNTIHEVRALLKDKNVLTQLRDSAEEYAIYSRVTESAIELIGAALQTLLEKGHMQRLLHDLLTVANSTYMKSEPVSQKEKKAKEDEIQRLSHKITNLVISKNIDDALDLDRKIESGAAGVFAKEMRQIARKLVEQLEECCDDAECEDNMDEIYTKMFRLKEEAVTRLNNLRDRIEASEAIPAAQPLLLNKLKELDTMLKGVVKPIYLQQKAKIHKKFSKQVKPSASQLQKRFDQLRQTVERSIPLHPSAWGKAKNQVEKIQTTVNSLKDKQPFAPACEKLEAVLERLSEHADVGVSHMQAIKVIREQFKEGADGAFNSWRSLLGGTSISAAALRNAESTLKAYIAALPCPGDRKLRLERIMQRMPSRTAQQEWMREVAAIEKELHSKTRSSRAEMCKAFKSADKALESIAKFITVEPATANHRDVESGFQALRDWVQNEDNLKAPTLSPKMIPFKNAVKRVSKSIVAASVRKKVDNIVAFIRKRYNWRYGLLHHNVFLAYLGKPAKRSWTARLLGG